jgi:hypothetical protein
MWPTRNTAFIVIHGIGAHRPFATVDDFARGFWNVLKKENPGLEVRWHHKLLRHENWIESYVSLTAENMPSLDFYEYYWDCYMVREITSGELTKWLDQVSRGARNFYTDNPEIAAKHRQNGVVLFKDDDLKYINYVRPILCNIWWLKWLGPLLSYLPNIGPVMKVLNPFISKWMRSFMQDLVIYTSSDVRSQNYAIRQQILKGAVEEIKLLFDTRDCQIILAGHSLGSVIAYDALNRVVLDMNAAGGLSPELSSRIGGLVTFGSPLDKIYFFFQEPTDKKQFVQRQVLSHFHGYKRLPPKSEDPTITNPIEPFLNKSIWLNFYHPNDLVSGNLDAYEVDENVLCKYEADFFKAHGGYWTYNQMYSDIAERYF